eukprot:scaffold3603_cov69-Cylindrotheca_fusiformis.AAC.1
MVAQMAVSQHHKQYLQPPKKSVAIDPVRFAVPDYFHVAVPVVTRLCKRKASPRGDAATTSNHKTKMKRNSGSTKNGVLLDDKAVNALVYSNKAAEQDRMVEFARHNKAMERLEYKMNLLRKYKEIKTHFGWSDEKISQFYPDMQQVMEHGDDSSDDHSS